MSDQQSHAAETRLVYCEVCHKTHAVKPDETPCAPGAWRDSDAASDPETVMCSACSGTGQYDWDEIDIFSECGTCGGVGEVEVCAQCYDSGEECDACGCY